MAGPVSEHDYPVAECFKFAKRIVADGSAVFQKFSCEACHVRQAMPKPNVFYYRGKCCACGHVSDILKNGCNYMVSIGIGSPAIDRHVRIAGEGEGVGTNDIQQIMNRELAKTLHRKGQL